MSGSPIVSDDGVAIAIVTLSSNHWQTILNLADGLDNLPYWFLHCIRNPKRSKKAEAILLP
jgi:hypothetical protein